MVILHICTLFKLKFTPGVAFKIAPTGKQFASECSLSMGPVCKAQTFVRIGFKLTYVIMTFLTNSIELTKYTGG